MEPIKILFAGDFCVRYKGVEFMDDAKTDELAAPVKKLTQDHDISIVNVETVFTDNPTPTKKSGPNLSSPMSALELLAKYGFTIGAFANNHTMDQGAEAGLKSYEAVKAKGMLAVGFGKNLKEANKPIRITKKGQKISVFNFAEHEFVAATNETVGFAPIDFIENAKLIKEERKETDFVFVFLHAGSEHCPFPREGLVQYSRALVDAGADGVIIAHPHCPNGIEYYEGKPIVYSIGNFYMAKRNDITTIWNTGYLASLEIAEDRTISVTPIPYEFGNDGSFFRILDDVEKEKYLSYIDTLSALITNSTPEEYHKLRQGWSVLFMEEAKEGYLDLFQTDPAYHDDLLLFIRNAFSCETHTETLKDYYILLTENRLDDFEDYIQKIKKLQERPI